MTILDFLSITLAASGAVDVWKNGSIFATGRAAMQAKEDDTLDDYMEEAVRPKIEPIQNETHRAYLERSLSAVDAAKRNRLPWYWRCVPRPAAKMLNCAFCLSHHTPWILALLFFFPALWLDDPWQWLLKLPIYSLAATRLGTIINAWAPWDARYERSAALPYDEDVEYVEPTSDAQSEPA